MTEIDNKTERARLIQYAEGIVHAAIYGPEMGWTHPEEEAQGKREAIEVVRALAAELAAAEKRTSAWERAVDETSHVTEECQGECVGERRVIAEQIRARFSELAAASGGKP